MRTFGALVLLFLGVAAVPASADERNVAKRFGVTTRGDIAIAGNVLITCNPADVAGPGGTCAAATGGTGPAFYNNEHDMIYVDIDGDATTFNSSRATLDLPAGAAVRFAGLYWAASGTGTGTAGTTPPGIANRGTVRVDSPAPGGYQTVTAPSADFLPGSATGDYAAVADVTGLVAAAGEGEYTVADVQAGTGKDAYAGWALVVAFSAPGEALRNLTVFDGYLSMFDGGTGNHALVTNTIDGFRTPATGPVKTRVAVIAYEGEVNVGGTVEGVEIDDTAVSGGADNPSNDLLNGTITRFAPPLPVKNPDQVRQVGSLDADLFEASGLLAPSSTSAKLDLVASTQDGWYAQVLTFATEVEQPLLTLTKTVTDVNGAPARAGDVLEYMLTAANIGNDVAEDVVVSDTVPAPTTFLGGSIVAGGASVSDAADADAGELAGREVRARLGTIAAGASKNVVFRATIPAGTAADTVISNTADVAYEIPASAIALNATSDPVSTTVAGPAPPDQTPTPIPTAIPVATPAATATPAGTATPVATVVAKPTFASVVVLPSTRKCVSRRNFRIRLVEPKGDPLVSATVFVNGKRVKVVKGSRLRARVDLRGLPKGRFTVKIVVKTKAGKSLTGSRRYRTCVPKRRK